MTWFDRYINWIARTWTQAESSSPIEIVRDYFVYLSQFANKKGAKAFERGYGAMGANFFMLTQPDAANVLGIQLDETLVEDFHGAHPPRGEEWREIFREAEAVYIEFPVGSYRLESLVPGVQQELRALFVFEGLEGNHLRPDFGKPAHSCLAIIDTGAGGAPITDDPRDQRKENLPGYIPSGIFQFDPDNDFSLGGMAIDGDPETFKAQMMGLIKLVCCYYLVRLNKAKQGIEPMLPFLPHQPLAEREKLSPKKQRAKLKTLTVFRTCRMKSPPNRFGRTKRESGERVLGRPVHVPGHFQHYWHKNAKTGEKYRELHYRDPYSYNLEGDDPKLQPIIKLN